MLDRLSWPQSDLDQEENHLDREEKTIERERESFWHPLTGRPVPQLVESVGHSLHWLSFLAPKTYFFNSFLF